MDRLAQQEYQLNARRLPRCLEGLCMTGNRLFGTVDLGALPRGLKRCNLDRNHICGPVHLRSLPPDLDGLNMSNNPIKQRVVYYEKLPDRIQHIRFHHCGISKFAPVSADVVENPAVFQFK